MATDASQIKPALDLPLSRAATRIAAAPGTHLDTWEVSLAGHRLCPSSTIDFSLRINPGSMDPAYAIDAGSRTDLDLVQRGYRMAGTRVLEGGVVFDRGGV